MGHEKARLADRIAQIAQVLVRENSGPTQESCSEPAPPTCLDQMLGRPRFPPSLPKVATGKFHFPTFLPQYTLMAHHIVRPAH